MAAALLAKAAGRVLSLLAAAPCRCWPQPLVAAGRRPGRAFWSSPIMHCRRPGRARGPRLGYAGARAGQKNSLKRVFLGGASRVRIFSWSCRHVLAKNENGHGKRLGLAGMTYLGRHTEPLILEAFHGPAREATRIWPGRPLLHSLARVLAVAGTSPVLSPSGASPAACLSQASSPAHPPSSPAVQDRPDRPWPG